MIVYGSALRPGMRVKWIKYSEGGTPEICNPPATIETYAAWGGEPCEYFDPNELGVVIEGGWRPICEQNRFKVVFLAWNLHR